MAGHEYICGEDQLEVSSDDSSDIDIGPALTEGEGDSDVFKALRKKDGKLLAVKVVEIPRPESGSNGVLEGLEKELLILNKKRHKNIVRYRKWSFHTRKVDEQMVLHIYSDFLRHDTLEKRYKEFALSERQISLYAKHILSGIAYLHGNNILHRDIRCGNIWVDDEAVCKLANFGKAKELRHKKERLKSTPGRPHWMAPELALGGEYGERVDIWSLGCTILEMLTGQRPFEADGIEVHEFDLLDRLKMGIGPTIPEYRYSSLIRNDSTKVKISPTARDFVDVCLQVQPERRPKANELLRHPFIIRNLSTRHTQRAARVALFPSEDPEEFELVSMSEDQQTGAVQLDTWQRHSDDLSVKQMCRRISKELEKNASDSSVIIISNDWLIKWQSDDNNVYAKLLDFGYMKTLETDAYSCFENITDTLDGGCSCCDDVQSILDLSPEHVVSQGISQASGYCKEYSLGLHEESSTSGTKMQDGITVDDHGTSISFEETGTSGEENMRTAIDHEVHDSKVSIMCSGHCPHIPLSVVKSKDSNAASSSSSGTPVALTVLRLESQDALFEVSLALSCCADEDQLCIKISCLKGEIFPLSAAKTVRLRQTRLSISAKVGDQIIVLRPVDPENDRGRVCSTGRAHSDYQHGKKGSKIKWGKISPGFSFPFLGGLSLGEAGMYKRDDKVPVSICGRKESLDLVVLKVGHGGTRCFNFQKVLVLERDIRNTYLAREEREVSCMDSQADSRPVVLMGNFHLDSPSSDGCHHQRSVEITCCAQLEIDFIPDEMKYKEIIDREIMWKTDRTRKLVTLCQSPGTGHVTFKGMVTTNIQNP